MHAIAQKYLAIYRLKTYVATYRICGVVSCEYRAYSSELTQYF